MNDELKPCPCGKVPTKILIDETLSGKWINFYGNCCSEWMGETRNNYAIGDERERNAIDGWNAMPRTTNTEVVDWIPVSERLPDDCETVLCYEPNCNEDVFTYRLGDDVDDAITHWMPLPEPPEV